MSRATARSGGARRDRTADLLRARQALSQLSYGPSRLSFFRLALLFARSVGHVPVSTLPPSLASRRAKQKKSCASTLPSQKIPARLLLKSIRVAIFRSSRRGFATHSLLCERDPNAEIRKMVGLGRFELPTSPLSGVRSNQLSYRPKVSRCLNVVHWVQGCC